MLKREAQLPKRIEGGAYEKQSVYHIRLKSEWGEE